MLDPVDFLLDLLRTPSPTGSEGVLAAELAQVLRMTFPLADVDLQDLGDGGSNVLMRQGTPEVVFTSHLDTVPGDQTPTFDGKVVHGRGACDAKGQIAAQVCALQRAVARGATDVGCFYVCGEEVDSRGALAALAHPFTRARAVLNGEPTDLRFTRRSWGILELEVSATGVAGHSSTAAGPSAVHALVDDLGRLCALESADRKVNVGVVAGGEASNVIAPSAHALVGIRFRDDADALLADVRAAVRRRVRVRQVIQPVEMYAPSGHLAVDEVHFASDAVHYAGRFDFVVQYGPGAIEYAHTDDERVAADDLQTAVDVLARLAGAGL